MHTANGGLNNLERHFPALQFGLPNPPTLGHRLDLGTSGCLVLARHRQAAQRLRVLFSENRIKKTYWAIAAGDFPQDEGRIDIPLSKQSTSKRHWWMKADPEGDVSAITDYRVLGRGNGLTWLELSPQTGRTHQLRIVQPLVIPSSVIIFMALREKHLPKTNCTFTPGPLKFPSIPKRPPFTLKPPPHLICKKP